MNWQAYDPTWAFHTALRARAARWQRRQQIGSEQLLSIEAAYPLPYYQPGWPVRVALFIFTWIALVMAGSILALFLAIPFSKFLSLSNSEMVHPIGLLFILLCFTALEQLIRKRRFYHAGTDTALLYAGLGIGSALLADAYFTGSGHTFFTVEESTTHYFAANGFVPLTLGLLLMLAAAVRYADVLATAVACGAAGLLVPECALTIPSVVPLLPFLLMATAGAAWLGSRAVGLRLSGTALADYYAACLRVVKLLALTVFYLSGNYLVVREGYESLYSYQPTQNPFAPLFWAFTAIVPLLYLWWGLRRGDRPTLLLGMLALAFSLFTLRHYRSVLPPEIASVAGGLLLTVAAGALLRFLRPARIGLTSLPDDEPRHFSLETLIQAQTAHAPGAPVVEGFSTEGVAFGGGHSGGGGATGAF